MEKYPPLAAFTFVAGEAPVGAVSGLNTNYSLAHTPVAGSLHCYIAGLRVTDFLLSGLVVTIVTVLVTGTVVFDYAYA